MDFTSSLRRALLAGAGALILTFNAAHAREAGQYQPNEVIVKYKSGALRARDTMNSLYNLAGVAKVRRFAGLMKGFEHLILDGHTQVEQAIAALQGDSSVEFAQPNYILHMMPVQEAPLAAPVPQRHGSAPCIPGVENPACDPTECLFPDIDFPVGCHSTARNPANPPARPELRDAPATVNPPIADPDLDKDYALSLIGAREAWKHHQGNRSFIVADIDTGADYNHEDLAPNLWRNPHPSEKNDIVGYDFVHDDGLPFDDHQHGTHTGGTIGAALGNGKGAAGVIPKVSLMVLKFLGSDGNGTTADAVRAIDYAISHGAKVLNNSWGGTGDDNNKALYEAIERARTKDVLFVAAAGNDGANNDGDDPSFPASFDNDNLISVAATDANDRLAFFSNYGKRTTHLAAPGVGILSTLPGNRYAQLSGTSMACPHVAGAAALIWTRHPRWTYRQVKDALLNAVDPIADLKDKVATGGRLNVFKAMHEDEE